MQLVAQVDRTDSNQHAVTFFHRVRDQELRIEDIQPLLGYGYRKRLETRDGPIFYILSDKDRQTLLAIKSMNPQVAEDGALLFDFAPTILNYLRTKENLDESPDSEKLQVSHDPLKPTAKVNLDPQQGLTVDTGYEVEETGQMLAPDELTRTVDGDHVLIGDTFYPLPKKLSSKAKEWLIKPRHQIPLHEIPEFVLRDLVVLQSEFSAVLTDLASQIKIVEQPFTPVVHVQKDDRGWLDFYVGYESGAHILPHDLLSKVDPDNPYIQVDETTWIKADPKAIAKTEKQLKQLEPELTETGYRVPIERFASLEEAIENMGGKAELGRAYQEFLNQLSGFEADERYPLSAQAEADLQQAGIRMRPYQRAGVHWLDWLFRNHVHGILADDMGLGKTLQTICIIRRAYEQSHSRMHSLVLAPKSVLHHWERELRRFFLSVRIYRYHGPGRRRDLLKAVEPLIFITTYSTASNDLQYLVAVPFLYIILDEATYIKNPSSRRSQSVKALNGAHRLALTGTPVENRPQEIWSLYDFLMRGHLGKHGTFNRLFEERIAAGDKKASERLGQRIRPFLLRRLKGDVAKDLPEKIKIDEWCQLSEELRQLYGGLQGKVKELRGAISRGEQVNYTTSIFPVLTKLKQICDHPALVTTRKEPLSDRSEKFDWILNKVDEIHQNGERVAIFSHFLGMLDLLEKAIIEKGRRYVRIDGSTNNRQQLIDRINEGHADIALCSIQATGHGINMTGANHVIHADRWWNPAIEDQATDRVHRIGQDKTVYVYRILVENTLEERIDTLLESKRKMAGQIVTAATQGIRAWSREELLELLRPLDDSEGPRDYVPRTKERQPVERTKREVPIDQPPTAPRSTFSSNSQPVVQLVDKSTRPPANETNTSDRLQRVLRLSRNQDPSSLPELVAALADPDKNIRWLAGSSLVQRADPDVVTAITAFLNGAEPERLERALPEANRVLEMIADTAEDEAVKEMARATADQLSGNVK